MAAGQEEMEQSPRASPVKNIILGLSQARWDSTRVWSPYTKVYGPSRESRMTQKVGTLCLLLPVTHIQNVRHSVAIPSNLSLMLLRVHAAYT